MASASNRPLYKSSALIDSTRKTESFFIVLVLFT
jgi:hypothetical protein